MLTTAFFEELIKNAAMSALKALKLPAASRRAFRELNANRSLPFSGKGGAPGTLAYGVEKKAGRLKGNLAMSWVDSFYNELAKLAEKDPELDNGDLKEAREERDEKKRDSDPRNVRKHDKKRFQKHNTREQDEVEKEEADEDKGATAHDEVDQ